MTKFGLIEGRVGGGGERGEGEARWQGEIARGGGGGVGGEKVLGMGTMHNT